MARTHLKMEDARKINLYVALTDADVDFDGGTWFIDTPNGCSFYKTAEWMMEDINVNLEESRRLYEEQGELDEWERLVEVANKTRFRLSGESDRMKARR